MRTWRTPRYLPWTSSIHMMSLCYCVEQVSPCFVIPTSTYMDFINPLNDTCYCVEQVSPCIVTTKIMAIEFTNAQNKSQICIVTVWGMHFLLRWILFSKFVFEHVKVYIYIYWLLYTELVFWLIFLLLNVCVWRQNVYFCSTDDGSVRIWRNYLSEGYDGKELVSAFQAITDLIPTVRRKFLHKGLCITQVSASGCMTAYGLG